jgi:hypothetical protein
MRQASSEVGTELSIFCVRSSTMKGDKWYGETGCSAFAAADCSSIYIDKRDYTLQLKRNKNLKVKATNLLANI